MLLSTLTLTLNRSRAQLRPGSMPLDRTCHLCDLDEVKTHFISYNPFYYDLQVKLFLEMSARHPRLFDMTD